MSLRRVKLLKKEMNGDVLTPVMVYEAYVKDHKGFILESKDENKGRYSFIGRCENSISYENDNLYLNHEIPVGNKLFEGIEEILSNYELVNSGELPFEGGLVGNMGYDVVSFIEKLPSVNEDEIDIPIVEFMLCREFIVFDHFHNSLQLVVLADEEKEAEGYRRLDSIESLLIKPIQVRDKIYSKPTIINNSMDEDEYISAVNKIKQHIIEGDIFQAVISRRYTMKTDKDPFSIYRSLRRINPSPYLFFLNFGDYQILGSSPEMLVEKRGNKIATCPIAGTRKRGKNHEEDVSNAKDLLEDKKEIAEHMMLVDLSRNDMGRIAEVGSVEVTKLMDVQKFSHVMHLVSLVEGKMRKNMNQVDVLKAFFPAGTLSGAPKIRAMELIDEVENTKRNFYGGSIGYFSFNKDIDMCITIRSMVVKHEKAYLQAGAGIVIDSVPSKEYEETENKLKAAMKALE